MPAKRIGVVIEDDLDFRDLLKAILVSAGLMVHGAEDGTAGIATVRKHNPAMIVVDFGLPDMTGLEVTKRIREFSDAHILMLTGRADAAGEALAAGVNEFMTKPFNIRELRQRIAAALR